MFLEIIALILGTTLTIFLAVFAYRQVKINETQVRLGLFEKRFDFYRKLKQTLLEILSNQSSLDEKEGLELLYKYSELQKISIFLFDPSFQKWLSEVYEILGELRDVSFTLKVLNNRIKESPNLLKKKSEHAINAKKHLDLNKQLRNIHKDLESYFIPYLDFSEFRISPDVVFEEDDGSSMKQKHSHTI